MRFQISFEAEVESVQRAAAIRDKMKAWLTANEQVTITNWNASRVTEDFRVYGWDAEAAEPFVEAVEAVDATEAATLVTSAGSALHVVHTEPV